MTVYMSEDEKIMAGIETRMKSVKEVFCTIDGVTLDSLEIENIKAPNLDFFGSSSAIEIPVRVDLSFGNEHKAGLFLVFKSEQKVNSLDKATANNVVQSTGFWCDYEQDDEEWEFSDNLSVIISTKDDSLITAVNSYDSCFGVVNEEDDDGATVIYARENLAGAITEYFSCYMSGIGSTQGANPALRDSIMAALREQVAISLA